jgi:hypothetical protein
MDELDSIYDTIPKIISQSTEQTKINYIIRLLKTNEVDG